MKFGGEGGFVLKPPNTLGEGMFCGRGPCQNLRWGAVPSAAVEDEVRVFSEGIEDVPRWTRDGGHPRRHGPLPQDANFDEKLEGLSTPNDANGRRVFLPQAADSV